MDHQFHFQDIILKLQHFWHTQGCLIWQPYNTQVGAGTFNPATVLRVLGPEPWNVAYVEPSIRPDDARYGENPYRMQQHYQFQVILKPDPGNPQELYLRSLQAIGIDPRRHDIRFVEDNWESPALGAWGLGWEVWLDGQEITQFTYFQQAGGMAMNPVSVEITYGLERITMPLQRVRHFTQIQWSPERTYGDVNLVGEQEHSRYYFEVADVERLRSMFDLYEKEAELALAQDLVLPAHDYVLKCSHTFNVLDTRGAVGVTERQELFRRMRDISRKVAEQYVEQRRRLGFPWLVDGEEGLSRLKDAHRPAALVLPPHTETLPAVDDFLFEIGVEELPVGDQKDVLAQLEKSLPEWLAALRLEYEALQVMCTPRRLVIFISKLGSKQGDITRVIKGPPAERAFAPDGSPTQAAIGFARGKGLPVEALEVREMDGGRYAAAVVHEQGKNVIEVLSGALPEWVAAIKFNRPMRWNSKDVAFSRPVRWLLALYGKQVVFCEYAGLQSGRVTRGLRFHDPEEFEVENARAYFAALQTQGIILDPLQRKEAIRAQVSDLMREIDGDTALDEYLLDEVNHLVEAPTALRGKFAEEHLQLPEAVLASVMKKYQRYFPVRAHQGKKLLPYFIIVRNGNGEYGDVVTDGNELVIRARFADAAFFISEDLKHRLEDYLPRLSTLMFQFKLGSMLDKTRRIELLVETLARGFELPAAEIRQACRAAKLCKADLVTHMVVEMTALQGIMGQYYALKSGEEEGVALAIYEHYLPASPGDALPRSGAGFVLGLADRLDSMMGLFAVGLAPTGTRDPFGQRRMALGVIQNLVNREVNFDLKTALQSAAANLPLTVGEEPVAQCLDFITGRMRHDWLDQGYPYDVIDAVLAVQNNDPYAAYQAVKALTVWTKRDDWRQILPAYARCVRITRDQQTYPLDEPLLIETAEQALYAALLQAEKAVRSETSADDFFSIFLPMIPAVNRFFDEVLVMSEDAALRQNRLGLVSRVARLGSRTADFSRLEGF